MNDRTVSHTQRGERCPGPTWEELVAADSRRVPAFFAEDAYEFRGSEPLPSDRYTSAEFFQAEVEKIWPNVWQFAAREEELPDPGDVTVYENVGRSYLLARQRDGSVRAFHNVCLHRGRRLRTSSGTTMSFRCPYHGFSWDLDGSLSYIPCRWDFEHLTDSEMRLPEAETACWGGYIFLRENPGGPSLMEYLGPLPKHFERWPHDQRTTTVWVAKIIRANWKVVMEAFMEAWHSFTTHPQIAPFVSDANSRYNIYGDHVNVGFNAIGAMSPLFDSRGKSEQWILDSYIDYSRRFGSAATRIEVPPGSTARKVLGQLARDTYPHVCEEHVDDATDIEMLDSIFYSVFPNWGPWGGFMPALDYRFRPWPDQNRTLMEVRILGRVPKGQNIPRSVPMRLLDDSESWASSSEIGEPLGRVLDQDVANVEEVHAGLSMSKTKKVQLANYMEIRIRHFHDTADKYLNR